MNVLECLKGLEGVWGLMFDRSMVILPADNAYNIFRTTK